MNRFILPTVFAAVAFAQAPAPPSFDVASVKPNRSDSPVPNTRFPLGPGEVYVKGGSFSATGFPLISYILFAYRVTDIESVRSQLPEWVNSERFDIQAKTDGDPAKDTKDQMRLMMRSLLAERFGLATHYETRQVPVYFLVEDKPGKTGPQLRVHPSNADCMPVYAAGVALDGGEQAHDIGGGFPAQCGGFGSMNPTIPGRMRIGARNITMDFAAANMGGFGFLDRPLVDRTGLTGTVDMAIEFVPATEANPDGMNVSDPSGPTFQQALKEQLGLKLESGKAPKDFLIVDRISRLTEN